MTGINELKKAIRNSGEQVFKRDTLMLMFNLIEKKEKGDLRKMFNAGVKVEKLFKEQLDEEFKKTYKQL
jgi:hypothetical protein